MKSPRNDPGGNADAASIARLRTLADVTHALNDAGADLPRLFGILCERLGRTFDCGVDAHLRSDANPEVFELAGSWFANPEIAAVSAQLARSAPPRVGVGIRGRVAQTGVLVHVPHVDPVAFRAAMQPEAREWFDQYPIRTILVVPLVARGEVCGILGLYGYDAERPFTPEDATFAGDLADRAALVVANAVLYARVERELAARRRTEVWLQVCADLVQSVDVGLLVLGGAASLEAAPVRLENATARRALGAAAPSLGHPLGEVAPALVDGPVGDAISTVRATRRAAAVPEVVLGLGVAWAVQVVALPDESVGVVFYDLTERQRFEAERVAFETRMFHAQKLESLGVLAGGIAHDFNNLLVSMMGNASLALLALPADARARGLVERIEGAALRASDLTRQLLAYSGKGRFMVQPMELNQLVREMSELLQVSISKRAHLRLELGISPIVVDADPAQLQQVVLNLLTNASDAIGDHEGQIVVATGVVDADRAYLAETYMEPGVPDGRYAFVEVSDSGVGMPPEVRARIFEPFFSTKETGRGLGLAAVLGIVRGHRGTLRVYSEPGKGTTIKVLLPLSAEAAPPSPRAGEVTRPDAEARTVLVVDDEEAVRQTLRDVLEFHGFTVREAADGDEAIGIYAASPDTFALVILDMTMPRKSGAETFAELRRINPKIRAILSSGYNEQEVTSRFAGRGLAGFVQKPWTARDLVGKIHEVLGRGPDDTSDR